MASYPEIWKRASDCETDCCVEVAFTDDDRVHVRSSQDPEGAVLTFTVREWRAFCQAVAAGELHGP
jgi:uncharacterized protein YaeQ